jgi:putative DNA primase/helicase
LTLPNYEIDRIPTYYLYAFYKRYCKNNNFSPLGQAKFTRRFLAMLDGYETKSTKMTHDNIHQLKQISDNDELCIYESLPELNKAYRSLFKSNLHKKA